MVLVLMLHALQVSSYWLLKRELLISTCNPIDNLLQVHQQLSPLGTSVLQAVTDVQRAHVQRLPPVIHVVKLGLHGREHVPRLHLGHYQLTVLVQGGEHLLMPIDIILKELKTTIKYIYLIQ